MNAPVLSICIPSYNREAMAFELLRELDRPGYLPFLFDVVLVNNASPDSRYESVRNFTPRNFGLRYIELEQTIGAFENVWGSLRRATGEFCVYLADDDRLVPDALAEIVAVMQAQPELLATFAPWQYLDLVENRVTHPGAMLDDRIFDAPSAAQPLASLVERRLPPEIGVYRTIALARSLFPSALFYWPFLLIERLLMLGSVRFCSRPFYSFVQRRHDELGQRSTLSARMALQHWESIERGLDLWSRHLPTAWLGAVPQNSPLHESKHAYREMAFMAAARDGRFLEAFDLGLALRSRPGAGDYRLPPTAEQLEGIFLGAIVEALHEIYQTVPELRGLALHGFDGAFHDALCRTMAGFTRGRPVGIIPAERIAPAELPHHMMLTRHNFERADLFARGCSPGLVYSLQDLRRVFHV